MTATQRIATFSAAIALTIGLMCSLGATVYNVFSPGGALGGTWNSQTVNVGAGPSFILNQLPVGAGGTGLATLTAHGVLLGEGSTNVGAVAAMAADTLLQGQGISADPASVALLNCGDATHALAYSTVSHAFSCQSITGAGPGGAANAVQYNSASAFAGVSLSADQLLQGSAGAPQAVSVPNCGSSTQALSYSTGTHAFGCQTVGSATAVPGTIKDLVLWFESDNVLGTNGQIVYLLGTRVPWYGPSIGASLPAASSVTVSASTLNSLPTLAWSGNVNGRAALTGNGFTLSTGATIFAVYNPASFSSPANPTLFSGNVGSLELRTNVSGNVELDKSNTAVIATSSFTLTVGTWVQFNATYNAATGAFAFRSSSTARNSGTNLVTITAPSNAIGWDPGFAGQDLNGSLALLIVYDRVLTAGEISSVESYILSKWGV